MNGRRGVVWRRVGDVQRSRGLPLVPLEGTRKKNLGKAKSPVLCAAPKTVVSVLLLSIISAE